MLWVTIIERIVRNTSRPMSTGRQTLTNASSPTNARSPTASVAHGSRWPPPPIRIERPAQIPAPRNARRQRSSRSAPNCVSSPIGDDLLADDRRPRPEANAVLDDDRAARRRASLRRGRRPRRSARRASRSAPTFSAGESARNASGSARSDSRNAGVERARRSRPSSNVAGSDTPSVETPASDRRPRPAPRPPSAARSAPRRPSR